MLFRSRFDSDTKNAFLDFYTKIDAQATAAEQPTMTEGAVPVEEVTWIRDSARDIVIFSYKGETLEYTQNDLEELKRQGLAEKEIMEKVARLFKKIEDAKNTSSSAVPF